MKRHLMLVAAALFIVATVPASAQYWGVPGSAGDIDDAAQTLFDTDGPTLKFKSTVAGARSSPAIRSTALSVRTRDGRSWP